MIQIKTHANGRVSQWVETNVLMDGYVAIEPVNSTVSLFDYVLKGEELHYDPAPTEYHQLNSDGEWVESSTRSIPKLKMEFDHGNPIS